MKNLIVRAAAPLLSVALAVAVVGMPANAAEGTSATVLVKMKDGTVASAAADGTGGHVTDSVLDDVVAVSVPNMTTDDAVRMFTARADVAYAQPNYTYSASALPNDPCLVTTACSGQRQYNVQRVNAPAAWDITTGSPNMKIAIIDSGADITNPDLAGRVSLGPNFSTNPNNVDTCGHGSHVAGIAGAATNNGTGIAGVDWQASIVSVKVLDWVAANGPTPADCSGGTLGLAKAMKWSADNGVRIVNLSLGTYSTSDNVMADAVSYAQSKGVLIVSAANNDGRTAQSYPAAYPGVLAVGATDRDDNLAGFSNRGSWVDLVAPGVSIASTWSNSAVQSAGNYAVESGTSMSSPLVAGAASLLWSKYPYLSAYGVTERLKQTSDDYPGRGTYSEAGRLNIAAALSNVPDGYRFAAADGGIFSFDASFQGSTGGRKLSAPIVAMTSDGSADGYVLVGSDDATYQFFEGETYSTEGEKLNQPIVAAASSPSGEGFWTVASDGGVFSFGDAPFYGSTGNIKLNKPIVAAVASGSGKGYWLIASDGGVFAFGDAQFKGSTGNIKLNKPIVAAARSASGNGYWLIASDGGVFAFGDAGFYGSTGNIKLNQPIVGVTASITGNGYSMVASDGGVFSFGDAPFKGSTGSITLNKPIVAVAGAY